MTLLKMNKKQQSCTCRSYRTTDTVPPVLQVAILEQIVICSYQSYQKKLQTSRPKRCHDLDRRDRGSTTYLW